MAYGDGQSQPIGQEPSRGRYGSFQPFAGAALRGMVGGLEQPARHLRHRIRRPRSELAERAERLPERAPGPEHRRQPADRAERRAVLLLGHLRDGLRERPECDRIRHLVGRWADLPWRSGSAWRPARPTSAPPSRRHHRRQLLAVDGRGQEQRAPQRLDLHLLEQRRTARGQRGRPRRLHGALARWRCLVGRTRARQRRRDDPCAVACLGYVRPGERRSPCRLLRSPRGSRQQSRAHVRGALHRRRRELGESARRGRAVLVRGVAG